MSGDVGTSSPMPRATKRGIERTWAVEGLGPVMFSLRIATDQRWTRLPVDDRAFRLPSWIHWRHTFASVCPDLGL